jgi:hypothetical protein
MLKQVAKVETAYPGQTITVSLNVGIDRDFNDDEKYYFSKIVHQVDEYLRKNTLWVTEKDERDREKKNIIDLFDTPIYVEEIPNGYSDSYLNPWFIITTQKGRIKIGWRKRVINIDWTDSIITMTGYDVTNDEVTRDKRYMHAYGYEKAREYLNTLLKN